MLGILVIASLALISCSEGSTFVVPARENDQSRSVARETSDQKRLSNSSDGQASSIVEDDMADAPQEVAGGFLTCAETTTVALKGEAAYGCRVEKNGRKADISRFKSSWVIEDRSSGVASETGSQAFTPASSASVWHQEVRLPKAEARALRVRVSFEFGGGRRGSLSISLDKAQSVQHVAPPAPFRLGDASLFGSFLGSCTFRVITTRNIGSKLVLKVTVESVNTSVRFVLNGLCGVDTSNNTVAIKAASGETVGSTNLDVGADETSLLVKSMAPGTYTLEVAAGGNIFGSDDFLINEVVAIYDGLQSSLYLDPP